MRCKMWAVLCVCQMISSLTAIYLGTMAAMNSDLGGLGGRPTNPQANPFGGALHGTGSGLIRTGLEAYGGRILDSSSEFMQSNVSLFTDFLFRDQCNCLIIRKAKPHSLVVRLHNICPTRSTTFKLTASMCGTN